MSKSVTVRKKVRKKVRPISEREVWRYYISRDSSGGVLSPACNIWWVKPTRERWEHRVNWIPTTIEDPGHFGEYTLSDVEKFYHTVPETDLELVRVEEWSTEV